MSLRGNLCLLRISVTENVLIHQNYLLNQLFSFCYKFTGNAVLHRANRFEKLSCRTKIWFSFYLKNNYTRKQILECCTILNIYLKPKEMVDTERIYAKIFCKYNLNSSINTSGRGEMKLCYNKDFFFEIFS